MKAVFLFDLQSYFKRWGFGLVLLMILVLAYFAGQTARFSVSEDVFHDSPYQISFITALVSLVTIFFSTVFASQLVLKEFDNRFELLFFSTPITRTDYVFGRYLALLSISFLTSALFTVSFLCGQLSAVTAFNSGAFSIIHYIFPLVLFTLVNTFFTTSFLSLVGWVSKSRMMIYVSGLLLYILYMVTLLFSSSPFMAQSLPQSEQAKWISAITDPFGLSAFFYQTSLWPVAQRNSDLVSLDGIFIANRIMVVGISCLFLFTCTRKFSSDTKKTSAKPQRSREITETASNQQYQFTPTFNNGRAQLAALSSFVKINLIYALKSIPFVLTILILLFAVGMEMYAEIEKGIRIPQKYATSGLMATTIIQNFHFIAVIITVYYSHDLFWRSRNANFNLIENSTANTKYGFLAQWISVSALLCIFSLALVAEGIAFQLMYGYNAIESGVYINVIIFNTLPLILLCGFVLSLQRLIRQKYVALGLTALFALVMATSLGKKALPVPLLRFLNTISIDYSDMNGFGTYRLLFIERLFFGLLLLFTVFLLLHTGHKKIKSLKFLLSLTLLILMAVYTGLRVTDGYMPKSEEIELNSRADYEKQFRKYQNLPQPTVTDVKTTIELFPEENRYRVNGIYSIRNKTSSPIDTLIVNFTEGFSIENCVLETGSEKTAIGPTNKLITLKRKMLPGQNAVLKFEMTYRWKAINGHQPLNAIVENGSFMRISRYYPFFGYDAGNEIQEDYFREQFGLGKKTAGKPFDAPKLPNDDFINLEMTVSTSSDQLAIGVGELKKRWSAGNRNHFLYKTDAPVPFRFAVSSAKYALKKETYKGRSFEIYYHPKHWENVDHLLKNAKITMDYCETSFGPYPFKTIRFAEISGFTKGFAATAYPSSIFMTEDMIFHSNIKADQQQDVINELAGHELSHLWWGNSQIDPDDRDGAAMLTETLAMYTEMMLIRKMYGNEKLQQRLAMHGGIYNSEKGFSEDEPLFKVKQGSPHISYSKGAVVMCRLADLIGEDKVNLALRNFLEKNKYPNAKPISSDLMLEFYKVSNTIHHAKIDKWFKKAE